MFAYFAELRLFLLLSFEILGGKLVRGLLKLISSACSTCALFLARLC